MTATSIDLNSYLEFPGTLEDGTTEGLGSLEGRLEDVFTLEIGVTIGGASLEEVVSSSMVHLEEMSLT